MRETVVLDSVQHACCRLLPREAEDGMTMSVYSTVRDV